MVAQKLLILTFVRISFVRNHNAQSRLRGLNRGPSIARRRARDRLPPWREEEPGFVQSWVEGFVVPLGPVQRTYLWGSLNPATMFSHH